MAEHNDIGKQGEEIAIQHLEEKGYQVLDRNWRYGKGEVDVVCSQGDFIVFVEVKTRSSSFFGQPEEAVDKRKKNTMILAANAYVNQMNILREVRYDIISVIIHPHRHSIRHIEDAFYPTL